MSKYHAFSGIDDAIDRTKNLLIPFNWSIWWRIAVISLFAGSVGCINYPFPGTYNTPSTDLSNVDPAPLEFPEILIWLIVAVLLIVIIFTFISSVFQFVFVDCLSKKEFRLKKYFVENTGRGLRLFGFMLGLLFIVLAAVAALLLSIIMYAGGFDLTAIIPAFALFLIVVLFVGIISLFTIDFVVPVMLKDKCGVLAGWKKCWAILKTSLSQSIIYLFMKIVISTVVAILMCLLALIVLIIIGIPFFIIFLLLGSGFSLSLVNIILFILFLAITIPTILIACVPFTTYPRIYSLCVLEKMNPEYKLIE